MQADTRQLSLVSQQLAQFAKGPLTVSGALIGPNRCPVTDARQVLKGYIPAGDFRLLNNALADDVIRVLLEAPLAATQPLQLALGASGSDFLQGATQTFVVLARALHLFTAKALTVAVRRQIDDAEVYPQHVFQFTGRRLLDVAHGEQVERALDQYKVTLALPRPEQFALALAAHKRQAQPTVNGPDANLSLVHVPAENTVIVGNAARRLEGALRLAVQLVRVGHLRDATDHHLRRQRRERLSRRVVRQLVKVVLAERPRLPRLFTQPVARGVSRFQRALQGVRLALVGLEFDLCYQLHGSSIAQMRETVKYGMFIRERSKGASSAA